MHKYSAREAAFRAVLASLREECYVSHFLEQWQKEIRPSHEDYRLSVEIANGTLRRLKTLEWIAKELSGNDKIQLKKREKALLYTALYQCVFTDKIPLYAIINETVNIAKKQIHRSFGQWVNQFLRRVEKHPIRLPEDPSIRYSFPTYFIEALKLAYPDCYLELLEISNQPPKAFARKLGVFPFEYTPLSGNDIQSYSQKTDYYIQNPTPGYLMEYLFNTTKIVPNHILDLCASPGGKTLMLSERFPNALITANDISINKIGRLKENLKKYDLYPSELKNWNLGSANISEFDGTDYPLDKRFDLILIDAPCSNTGVLAKRCEARWRLSEQSIHALKLMQQQLVSRAMQLLNEGGEIWFLTCSILPIENEAFAKGVCCLPTKEGAEGGFACRITQT